MKHASQVKVFLCVWCISYETPRFLCKKWLVKHLFSLLLFFFLGQHSLKDFFFFPSGLKDIQLADL